MTYELYKDGRHVGSDWNRDRLLDDHFGHDDREARYELGGHGRAHYDDRHSCPTVRYEVRHRDMDDDY